MQTPTQRFQAPDAQQLLDAIVPAQRDEPDSGILQAVSRGFGRPDIIPLWTGEGNLPTPQFICDAAADALKRGETFYTWQRGIPELREALAGYHDRVFGGTFSHQNFFVTGGGMQAMQTIFQLITREGDEVIIPTPAWTNYPGPLRMKMARPVEVPMNFVGERWQLDLDRLFDALSDRTRAIAINSPGNPTGWVASDEELIAIRDFARQNGLWIVADEVYNRFHFTEDAAMRPAPSFLDHCDVEEKVLFANTFSKNWAMTGWRCGWLTAPRALGAPLERIIQYNTSGTAAFMQRGCLAAIEQGEAFLAEQVQRARNNRNYVLDRLSAMDGVRAAVPDGAFYQFFAVDGMTDSLKAALRIIDEAGVGLAPGAAFGHSGEGWLRLCFLRAREDLELAMDRLGNWLASAKPD